MSFGRVDVTGWIIGCCIGEPFLFADFRLEKFDGGLTILRHDTSGCFEDCSNLSER